MLSPNPSTFLALLSEALPISSNDSTASSAPFELSF
jgi:hypothetical protein